MANYRLIDDDQVFQPYLPIHWAIHRPALCPELKVRRDGFVELIFRDTGALNSAMRERLAEACRIVREWIGR